MGLVTIASIMLLVSVFIVSATCIYLIVTHPDNKNTDTITITPPTAWWDGVHEMD